MIRFTVKAWSAWAPGLENTEDWRRFAREPVLPALDGTPVLMFVPAMQRRRFSRLSRMALQSAFASCPTELLTEASTVFASRHGESEVCLALLRDIAQRLALPPTKFSHSVHNAQAGLFSIAAGNGRPSSSIAGQQDTFCAGLVEALGLCQRHRPHPTLLVVADEPIPAIFRAFEDELPAAFAAAWLVEEGIGAAGMPFEMRLSEPLANTADTTPKLPGALQFLAWMLGEEDSLALTRGRRSWIFRRHKN